MSRQRLPLKLECATVALTTAAPFIRLLRVEGRLRTGDRTQALRGLLARYDVSDESLAAEGARISHEMAFEIMHRSATLLGSDAIAIRALQHWRFGDHGIWDYLNASCSSIRQLLETIAKFVTLLHDGVRFTIRTCGERTFLNLRLDPDLTHHRWWPESYLGKVVVELRRALSPSLLVGIRAVQFSHRPPPYEREYRSIFPAPIEFSQSQDAIEFDTNALETSLVSGDPTLHGLLRRQAQGLLPPLRSKRSFLDWVRLFAHDELVTASIDQSRIAERLGVSVPTLRRRLNKEYGVRYADVLDELRRQIVKQWLVDPSISINDVCRRAGFSQKASFYRACKRWFRCSPVEYRQMRQKQTQAG